MQLKQVKYKIEVPFGNKIKLAKKMGVSTVFIARALRFDSDTSPSQIKIRDIAVKDFGGKLVKVVMEN